MKKLFSKTKMFDEAKRQSSGHIFIVEILIFAAVLLVTSVIASLPTAVYGLTAVLNDPEALDAVAAYNSGEMTAEEYNAVITQIAEGTVPMLIALFATGISTILTMIFCRFIEKRRVSTMGFRKKGFLREYLVGILVGAAMFSAGVGIAYAAGALTFEGISANIRWGILALFLAGFLVQGMSEEVTFRGYFMVSLSRRSHIALAIALSSIAFGCMHLGNPGVSALAVVNIILFGAFEGLYILKRGSIWGACAIHSAWNFVQGNIYGISVSGLGKQESLMTMSSVSSKSLINGGAFGLEGGLAVTCVTIAAIIVILLTKTNKDEYFDEETAPIIEPAITD